MLDNDLNLKILLMVYGVNLSDSAREKIYLNNMKYIDTTYYTTTSGIPLKIFGKSIFWVNTPINKNSNLILDYNDEIFYINYNKNKIKTLPYQLPNYYNKKNPQGIFYNDIMSTQIDRVNIFPIVGCSYRCKFCPISYTEQYQTTYDLKKYISAINIALNDKILPANHIQITGGVPKEEDFDYLIRIIEGIIQNFPNIKVDLMMAPKKGLLNFEKLKEIGLNGISLNMELYNDAISNNLTPDKFKDIGKIEYLNAINSAVKVFGKGNVRSILLVGLEPIEDTLKGVEEIAKRGADPILSPFIPDINTPLKDYKKPSIENLKKIFIESKKITDKYGVEIGPRCLKCQHNVLAIPY